HRSAPLRRRSRAAANRPHRRRWTRAHRRRPRARSLRALVRGAGIAVPRRRRGTLPDGGRREEIPRAAPDFAARIHYLPGIVMDAHEVIRRCRELAQCTDEPGHTTRTFLTPAMRRAHALVGAWMQDACLRVTIDAVGNIRGVRGRGPRLMIGSHLDTVPRAGAFDGVLG